MKFNLKSSYIVYLQSKGAKNSRLSAYMQLQTHYSHEKTIVLFVKQSLQPTNEKQD